MAVANKYANKYDKKQQDDMNALFKYIPAEPRAPFDYGFHTKNEDGTFKYHGIYKMVESIEELEKIRDLYKGKIVAVDTETTGLAFFQDYIVGFSLAVSSSITEPAYYIPIRHKIKQEISSKKATKLDADGNIEYTPAGRPRTTTVKEYSYHDSPYNIDDKKALDILYEIMLNAKGNLLHNAEFDLVMLQGEGYDTSKINFFDTMVLTYQIDAEARGIASLKGAEKHYLGRHRPNFEETIGGAENFQFTDPKDTFFYAAVDAQSTYGIYETLKPKLYKIIDAYKETLVINGKKYDTVKKDNKLIKCFVEYYGHASIHIDRNVAIAYKEKVVNDLINLRTEIYGYFNKGTFNLSTSSKDFKQAMLDKNIVTGHLTKTGNPSYGKDGLKEFNRNMKKLEFHIRSNKDIAYVDSIIDIRANTVSIELAKIVDTYGKDYYIGKYVGNNSYRVLDLNKKALCKQDFIESLKVMLEKEKEKYDILKKIQKNSSLNKAVNSYIEKLTLVDICKMRYKLFNTKSGRLASGNGSKSDKKTKNRYYIDLNAQNLSKPKSCFYRAYKSDAPDNILGWCYEQVSDEFAKDNMETEYIVEGFSPELNIRNCIIPPENKIIMSIDYESQEAKLLALLSQDSVMIKNFLAGIDPHTATAHGIWGKENYNKEIRKLAKMVNFLVNYGGGYGTLSNNAEIPLDEAKEILSKYEATFWECMEWKKRQVSKMYRNVGIVYTLFGRPRRLGSYIKVAEKNREEYDSLEMSRKCDGFIRAAERRVASHEIQGLAGDLCRYVLIKLYDKYFKNNNEDVAFMNVVHDEVNFYITRDHDTIIKYARELEDLMKFQKPGWQFPITTSIDLGNRWGSTIPYHWNEDKTLLLPKRVH